MEKRKAITEITTVELTAGKPAFVPFTENEKITNISFSKEVQYSIESVEELKEGKVSTKSNSTELDTVFKTKCLIITAEENVIAEIITIK